MEVQVGLFGWVDDANAEIKNLGLIDAHVYAEGMFRTGSLVGSFCGTLRDCYAKGGTVNGRDGYVGGLVGYNCGRVVACYSTCAVIGDSYVGGLVGGNYGRIAHCYSTGTVGGNGDVGGLVGYNAGGITDCYSAGSVDGGENAGGLVGRTKGSGRSGGSAEIDCFWDTETSGQTQSAGGTGSSRPGGISWAPPMGRTMYGLNLWKRLDTHCCAGSYQPVSDCRSFLGALGNLTPPTLYQHRMN